MNSIRNISIETNAGNDFYLLLGDYLDEFYKAPPRLRADMLREAPEDIPSRLELLPFLAATAHKLADDYGFTPPEWAFEQRCYLPGNKPYFGCGASGNLRLLFMYKSPIEFKHRNLFVDENVLVRV
jgi:hypothetical protein